LTIQQSIDADDKTVRILLDNPSENPMPLGEGVDEFVTFILSVTSTGTTSPKAEDFDVLAVHAPWRSHAAKVLLRRKTDGVLAIAGYDEGDDVGDDETTFAFVKTDEGHAVRNILKHHLEDAGMDDGEALADEFLARMQSSQASKADLAAIDAMKVDPAVSELEGLLQDLSCPSIRQAVDDAIASIRSVMPA
jgi:hypothetical protein